MAIILVGEVPTSDGRIDMVLKTKRRKYKVGINFSEDRRSIDDWKVDAL